MPVVSKTEATSRRPVQNGSMLSRAVDVSTLKETHLKFLIYGANRVGKTTIAVQFPKPLLLISFEPHKMGGATSVTKVKGVDYVKIVTIEEAMTLSEELVTDTHYKTHVIDTATSLQDLVLQALMGRSKPIEQITKGMVEEGQYVKRAEKTKDMLRDFLNLPAHTVVLAKEKDHVPQEQKTLAAKFARRIRTESFVSTDMGGGTAGWLRDACDYVARLSVEKEIVIQETKEEVQGKIHVNREEVETGEIVRRLRCQIHPNYDAGFRSCNPQSVPEYVEGKSPEELYRKVMQVIRGEYKVK